MENNRNFFITIALSVLILTLWQVFYMNPKIETERETARIEQERIAAEQKAAAAGRPERPALATPAQPQASIPGAPATQAAVADRAQALAASGRVAIDTPNLKGSINLTGARIDDISLKHYRVTVEPNSPIIELLNPQALPSGFYSEIGFVGSDATGAVPGPDTVWTAEANASLTPDDADCTHLRQRQGPDLQAHHRGRSGLHVHRVGHGDERRRRRRDAVELWPHHPLRQAGCTPRSTCCTRV